MTEISFEGIEEGDPITTTELHAHIGVEYDPTFEYEGKLMDFKDEVTYCRLEFEDDKWHWVINGEREVMAENIYPFMLVGRILAVYACQMGYKKMLLNW